MKWFVEAPLVTLLSVVQVAQPYPATLSWWGEIHPAMTSGSLRPLMISPVWFRLVTKTQTVRCLWGCPVGRRYLSIGRGVFRCSTYIITWLQEGIGGSGETNLQRKGWQHLSHPNSAIFVVCRCCIQPLGLVEAQSCAS